MDQAVIYARFSSDKQTEESIEAQVRACREYAAGHGLTVGEVYADEAISGQGEQDGQQKSISAASAGRGAGPVQYDPHTQI